MHHFLDPQPDLASMEAAVGAAAAAAVETPTHVSKVLPRRQAPWHPLDVRNSIQRAQQEAERKRSDAALMVRGLVRGSV